MHTYTHTQVARAGASPSTACEALDPSNYTQGLMLVFIQSSDCSALDQANNIINNGNSSVGGGHVLGHCFHSNAAAFPHICIPVLRLGASLASPSMSPTFEGQHAAVSALACSFPAAAMPYNTQAVTHL
eukprot:1157812-Pelagomonas_calceolata.AAC.4